MAIDKVHGLQTTGMSLNDRFTLLATAAPIRAPMRPRRRASVGSNFNQNQNQNYMNNRNLIEQVARHLELQAKRQAVKQRLGMLRRFGSESSLPGLRRSNSFGNLSQTNFRNRTNWRQSNGNLNRMPSFGNRWGMWRGFWLRGASQWALRGGNQRALRGRFRGGRGAGRVKRLPQRARRPPPAGARPRARGRGGVQRIQAKKPVPSKEELDRQLDQYMAGTKSALDKELDAYMENANDENWD